MLRLDNALRTWGTPEFADTLKQEIAQQKDRLPLQQGLSTGNYITAEPVTIAIHSVAETEQLIRVQAGIFYSSVIGGCAGKVTRKTKGTMLDFFHGA